MTRYFIDAWDPAYGSNIEPDGGFAGPSEQSTAQVDADLEVPSDAWQPLLPPPDLRPPPVILLVDGVRRIDAGLWTEEEDGSSYPGLAASYAAGVVRCDLERGVAELAGARVQRGLFTASPSAADAVAGSVRYTVQRVNGSGEQSKLPAAIQAPLTALEVDVSTEARAGASEDDLLVVDGPLRNRRQLARTIGYIKTQHRQYLQPRLAAVVTALKPGQRSPVFLTGTTWGAYSWYLRLPGRPGAPWAGIVRVECSADLPPAAAFALADVSLVTLPRFASTAYKDPRAPQNLIPIAGLERRLRSMLGDSRLLHRALTQSAARAAYEAATRNR
ncbi:hypothetical protein J2S43_005411 [Catenuloplanes nepalensis]|uniref:NurA domain-containing protein n=1 Tax=Catenuloplanes nepalensis TaxID=587533 RepID=A0ABT9MZL6_9ACTN|nr:hypothetical protein [Catenuloplanes nepalensis]MDP9796899.1 hypothetical protein [Catenuloplanes nepalensis]